MNRKGDEVAQLATEYSALEITYFKAVVRPVACTLLRRPTNIYFIAPSNRDRTK